MDNKLRPLRLGDLLVEVGKITNEQLNFALDVQKESRKKLGEVLQELGFITNNEIIEVLEFQMGIPHVDLEKYYIDPEVISLISEEFARNNNLIAIKKQDNKLIVAMEDPMNIIVINDLEIITGFEVEPRISTPDGIQNALNQYYSKKTAEKAVEEFTKEFSIDEETIDQNLLREINKAPVCKTC